MPLTERPRDDRREKLSSRPALGSAVLILALIMPAVTAAQTGSKVQERAISAQDRQRSLLIARQRQRESIARRYEQRSDYSRALTEWQQLYSTDSTRLDYFDGIRRCLNGLGRFDETRSLIRDRLDHHAQWENTSNLYAELGETWLLEDDTTKANAAFEQAIRAGGGPAGYQIVASVMAANRRIDQALAMLMRGRRELKNPTLYASSIAPLLKARMDWKGAAEEYLLTARTSESGASYSLRGMASIPVDGEGGKAVDAAIRDELKQVRKEGEPWDGYRLTLLEALANRYKEGGDFVGALNVISEIDSLRPVSGTELIAFAGEAMGEGREDVAASALRIASKRMRDPRGQGVVNLARASLAERSGHWREADSLYSQALLPQASPDVEQHARLLRGMLRLDRLKQPELAKQDFRTLLKRPDRGQILAARYGLARALAMEDSLEPAREVLAAPMPGEPEGFATPVPQGDIHAGLLAARIALWERKPALAAGLLEWVMVPPSGSDVENDALEYLRVINGENDSTALAAFADADRAIFRGDTASARSEFSALAQKGQGLAAEEAAWRNATLALDQGDTTAIVDLARDRSGSPLAERAWLAYAEWQENRKDLSGAVKSLEELLISDPEGLLAPIARLRHDRLVAELASAS